MVIRVVFMFFEYNYLHAHYIGNRYDHPHIMAGQGTVGLEILEDVADADAIIVPVGGGGLLAGVSLAVKTLNKNCKIIVSVIGTHFVILRISYNFISIKIDR